MTNIDIGKTYGSLTVVSQSPEQKRSRQCECLCLCGNKVITYTYNLIRFKHKTCFCAQRDKIRLRKKRVYAKSERKCKPEYSVWKEIRKRCFNKNCKAYSYYGGRGITMSAEWNDFFVFYSDMGPRPSEAHTIERIDNNGNYGPGNCRWATQAEQNANTRKNHVITYNGETKHLSAWARTVGLSEDCLERRLNKLNWPIEKALVTPNRGWGPGKPRIPILE